MSKKQKAIFYIILSAFFFALMNCFVRLSGDLPTVQKSFFRNFIAMIAAGFILFKEGIGLDYKKNDIPLLILRSAMGTIGILGNFYAVDHLNLSDASMLNKLSPFFAIIFSMIFLKEKPKLIQYLGVITAFIGSLFIIKPAMEFTEILPALTGTVGGMGAGAAYTAVRALGQRGVKGPLIVFFFSAFSCIAVLPWVIAGFEPMEMRQLGYLLLAGTAATGGQFTITAAYSNAPAKEISIFDYTQIIFAALMGFFLFSDVPDIYSIIGYIIICGASAALFVYNNKQ
ncbi:MAG: DMT family transporter [Clostridia bacterium]|nr:DMT family transporter [Clostridia bacterium]